MTRRRSVLVLAGVDRPLLSSDGPTLGRVVATADAVADDVVVSCPADRRAAVERRLTAADAVAEDDYRLAADPVSGDGLVAAIRTGVRVATAPTVAVVAGDACVDAALLDRLFEGCQGAGDGPADADTAPAPDAAVPRADGRCYPLHAVYDAAAVRAACDRTLAAGSGRLSDVLARLEPTVVSVDTPAVRADASGARARTTPASVTDHAGT